MNGVNAFESLREFEKSIFKNAEIDVNAFPPVSEEDIIYMEQEAATDDKRYACCFAYCRKKEETPFIDIYIWDPALLEGYCRFILVEGFGLSKADEDRFDYYFSFSDVRFDLNNIYKLVNDVKAKFPHIHVTFYQEIEHILIEHIFYHLFYTITRTSGVKELLFKAGLNYLAMELDEINDYDLIATTPQNVYDGVSLAMLHALNTPYGVEVLRDYDDRMLAKKVYAMYHNLIHGRELSEYQYKYLLECIERGEQPAKKRYDFLGEIHCEEDYYMYLRYLNNRELVQDYYYPLPQFPQHYELWGLENKVSTMAYFIENEERINFHMQRAAQHYEDYKYEDGKYFITVASTLEELYDESAQQRNCLWNYTWSVSRQGVGILFMRSKSAPKKSLITIEVRDGRIVQALQKCNHQPTKEQKKFLRKFAEEKNLLFG